MKWTHSSNTFVPKIHESKTAQVDNVLQGPEVDSVSFTMLNVIKDRSFVS